MTHWYPEDFTFQPTLQSGGQHLDSTKVMPDPVLSVSDRSVLLPLTPSSVCAHVCLCSGPSHCGVSVLMPFRLVFKWPKVQSRLPDCNVATVHADAVIFLDAPPSPPPPPPSLPFLHFLGHSSLCYLSPASASVSTLHYPPPPHTPPPCPTPSIYLPCEPCSEPAILKFCNLRFPTTPMPPLPVPLGGCASCQTEHSFPCIIHELSILPLH